MARASAVRSRSVPADRAGDDPVCATLVPYFDEHIEEERHHDLWLLEDGGTNWGEQQLYLQQPGYGTSYLTGKLQIEALLGEKAHEQGSAFSLRRFFDDFYAAGMAPVALIASELRSSH